MRRKEVITWHQAMHKKEPLQNTNARTLQALLAGSKRSRPRSSKPTARRSAKPRMRSCVIMF
nr:MAG TPA: hypothetical protein [Caudoviricetes sp.]